MYGIVVVSHGSFAKGIIEASEMIMGDYGAEYSGLFPNSDLESFEEEIKSKIKNELERYGEVIVFTDLMGGTPFNIVTSLMEEYNFNHYTGINLPLLLEVVMLRESTNLEEIYEVIENNKCNSIINVNDMKF